MNENSSIDTLQHYLNQAAKHGVKGKGAFTLKDMAQIITALSGVMGIIENSKKKDELINRLQLRLEPKEEGRQPSLADLKAVKDKDENTKR